MKDNLLARKINTAGAWFTGSFLGEFIHDYERWHFESSGKADYIDYFYREYGAALGYSKDSTKTKCYAVMEIIENHLVLDAIGFVLKCNDNKIHESAQENAICLLDAIQNGSVILP